MPKFLIVFSLVSGLSLILAACGGTPGTILPPYEPGAETAQKVQPSPSPGFTPDPSKEPIVTNGNGTR